MTLQDNI